MTRTRFLPLLALALAALPGAGSRALAQVIPSQPPEMQMISDAAADAFYAALDGGANDVDLLRLRILSRVEQDFAAMEAFRPSYPFWRHIFTIPDGQVAFGSGTDGRLLASFPSRGDWVRSGSWEDRGLVDLIRGESLPRGLTDRRERVAGLFEPAVGPVVHNPTRGNFLIPNARVYGGFLDEWAAIYERFGVPAEIGLAQAILESGLNGETRSPAGAMGFCQWLPRNWRRLDGLSEAVIEVENQTTQAPYCAAYLLVLSVKYGSFIPALSEHHAGGANVGRTVITGERLGGANVREQYLLGSQFVVQLREMAPRTYTDVYRTYGPRSHLYAEMVFGNAATVRAMRDTIPQERVFAVRATRAIPLAELRRVTGLSTQELQRFNPALVRQVPKGANVYLPEHVADFGTDVSFWHRAPSAEFSAVLNDFVALETTPEAWDAPSFDSVIEAFRARFRATDSEEGDVMDTVLGYVMQEREMYHRVLTEYRESDRVRSLFEEGRERLRQGR